ncbi:hypothetical protein BDB00DRAFT_875513 [Zychaea mexicana]|uniref:uncharacterized protein n=1 Tax=Zychaea mexicana TaxID=64656 RepID=UPI0022FF4575|nr:uncharacterized protein BDB00DRAFT_875513 [Zychaea mexicana]KAI9490186.1 hypothetical protein BDB00DRAFT_875513 [Zychaea mexicana]
MTYPGVEKIGHVERFRFSHHPRSSDILLFAFDYPGMDPDTACTLFEEHFSQSSLEEFRIMNGVVSNTSIPPVIIEALFSNRIEYSNILKNAALGFKHMQKQPLTRSHDEKEDGNSFLALPGLRVYQTAPKDPQYIVYALSSTLPLDSPSMVRNVVSSAVIERIASCFSITNGEAGKYLVDVLVDSSSLQQRNDTLPLHHDNSNACFIVNIPTHLMSIWNCGAKHNMFIYNTFYTLSRWPSKYYFYCQHCRSLDHHNTVDCPNENDTIGSL